MKIYDKIYILYINNIIMHININSILRISLN